MIILGHSPFRQRRLVEMNPISNCGNPDGRGGKKKRKKKEDETRETKQQQHLKYVSCVSSRKSRQTLYLKPACKVLRSSCKSHSKENNVLHVCGCV